MDKEQPATADNSPQKASSPEASGKETSKPNATQEESPTKSDSEARGLISGYDKDHQKMSSPEDNKRRPSKLNVTNGESNKKTERLDSEAGGLISGYDEDQSPPNVELAIIHGEATKVYAAIPESEKNDKRKVCICCGNAYDLQKLSICCNKSELYHLGVGFPMYFEFVIFSGVLIVIMLAVSGVYNIVTNVLEHDCEINADWSSSNNMYCYYNKIHFISLVNKRFSSFQLLVNDWLNLGAVVLMILSFQIYRRQSKLTIQEVDNWLQTPSDFTVMISNLPKDAKDDEIKDFFEKQLFENNEVQVAKIVRGYDIGKYITSQRRKTALQALLANKDVKDRLKLEKEYKTVKKEVDDIEDQSGKGLEASTYAFVTFEKEEQAQKALKQLSFTSLIQNFFFIIGCYSCFSGKKFRNQVRLNVSRAPEPSDIIWENLGTPHSEKRKRRFITNIVSAIVIIICGAILIGVNIGKNKLTEFKGNSTDKYNAKTIAIQVLSVLIAFLISILNTSLKLSTRKFASYEHHSTYTNYFVSVAQRLSLTTFINTAITVLVTAYILEILWKEGGLLTNIFIILLIAVILGPVFSIMNPWYFMRLCKRRSIKKQGKLCTLTQKQANLWFEGPAIDMAQCYSVVLKSLWLTAFYAPVLPIGLPISLVGLFLTYWTDKYLLLNRYVKPLELGKTLSQSMAEFLELTPFFFALGNLVFRYLIIKDAHNETMNFYLPSILGLGISFLYFVLPAEMFTCGTSTEKDSEYRYQKTYSEMRIFFNNDYAISNPIYHNEALGEWLEILKKGDKEKFNAVQELVKAEIKPDDGIKVSDQGRTAGFDIYNLQNYAQRSPGLANPQFNAPPPQNPVFYNQPDVRTGSKGNTLVQDPVTGPGSQLPIQYGHPNQVAKQSNPGGYPQNSMMNPNTSLNISYGEPLPRPVQSFQQPSYHNHPNTYLGLNQHQVQSFQPYEPQNQYPQSQIDQNQQYAPQLPQNIRNMPQQYLVNQQGAQFNGLQQNGFYNQHIGYPQPNQGIQMNPNNSVGQQASYNYPMNYNPSQNNPY